ncbi:MAG: rubrerythrin family protein [Hespellia sp.]|nr:rubrerythrin family protein [Hespellia sp.]
MAICFEDSKTKENLMRAFAGESQARNRYTFAAEELKKQGMYTIADMFLYTADQERGHAERFYNLLSSLGGETVYVEGGYPIDYSEKPETLLRRSAHNEHEEFDDVYPAFGDIAKEEGFLEVASAFYQIAEIEHVHELRFSKLADMVKDSTYYESPTESKWMCTNCGYIHEGKAAPQVCPVCRHERGYFIPLAFAQYLGCIAC